MESTGLYWIGRERGAKPWRRRERRKERERERKEQGERDAETEEREDVANSVILRGGHIQGPKNVTMGGQCLPRKHLLRTAVDQAEAWSKCVEIWKDAEGV